MSAALSILQARAALYRRVAPNRSHLDFMRSSGLALPSLGAPDPIPSACGCIVVAGIRREDHNRFVFADPGEGELAAIIEAFGRDGATTMDLAAWPVDRPAEALTMFGRASMLGIANVYDVWSYAMDRPLRVWRTPLRWLQEGGRGAVILDRKAAAHDLLDATERGLVSGEDRRHSEELARLVGSLFDRRRFVAPVNHPIEEAA